MEDGSGGFWAKVEVFARTYHGAAAIAVSEAMKEPGTIRWEAIEFELDASGIHAVECDR